MAVHKGFYHAVRKNDCNLGIRRGGGLFNFCI
jgi:hypothetical protein